MENLPVKSLLPVRRVVVCARASDSLEVVLHLLSSKCLLSLPIVRDDTPTWPPLTHTSNTTEQGTTDGPTQLLGVLDMMDILFVLVTTSEYAKEGDAQRALQRSAGDALALAKQWKLSLNPALDLGAAVSEGEPLSRLLTLMWGGWHRVPVVETSSTTVVAYLSQSDVVRFFANNANALKSTDTMHATLAELGLATSAGASLVTAPATLTAFDVAVRLVQHNVTAAPIVDATTGKIVANFSSSDLRFLTRHTLPLLRLPVCDFLAKVSQANNPYAAPPSVGGLGLLTPQTLRPQDSFGLALYKITALRCHRLWVVDEKEVPVGVVSLGDLMRVFLYGK